MISVRVALLVLILYLFTVILFAVNAIYDHEIGNFSSHGTSILNNTTLSNLSIENSSTLVENLIGEGLTLPSQEYILQNINWSNYSLLQNPYFHNHEVSDPTEVVDHKFLYVVIVVEINDAKNRSEILKQISGVVLEERRILGPNSGPTIWGTVDGICVYYAALRPYETDVFARYIP
jgi:hypothetical protein